MGLNYRKSINIAKGIRLNLSKSGPSISFGKNGLRFSLNSRGQASGTLGIPGTGLFYNKRINVFNTIKKFFTGSNDGANEVEENLEDGKGQVTNSNSLSKAELLDKYIEALTSSHLTSDDLVDWNEVIKNQDPKDPSSKNIIDLAKRVLNHDDDAYLTVVGEMEPFNDLLELGSEFEVGMIDDNFMGVTFNIKEDEAIPSQKINLLKSGKESVTEMSKTSRTNLIRDYVSSTIIRVARDLFSLLPVERLVVNAEDKRVNPATGKEGDVTLVSVIFTRDKFMDLNFSSIVPFETIKSFENNMDFKITKGGFQEVLPLK